MTKRRCFARSNTLLLLQDIHLTISIYIAPTHVGEVLKEFQHLELVELGPEYLRPFLCPGSMLLPWIRHRKRHRRCIVGCSP